MIKFLRILFFVFIIYSVVFIVYTEFLRPVDISEHEINRFHANDYFQWSSFYFLNISLSQFFLWATALLFWLTISCTDPDQREQKEHCFYVSQIFLFILLGLSYSLMLDKLLEKFLLISPIVQIMVIAFLEFLLLVTLLNLGQFPSSVRSSIFKAGGFFVVTVITKSLINQETKFGISIENLSTTWTSMFLFIFAWNILYDKIISLKIQGHTLTDRIVARRTENERKERQPAWIE